MGEGRPGEPSVPETVIATWPPEGPSGPGDRAFACGVTIAIGWFVVCIWAPPHLILVGLGISLMIVLYYIFVWKPSPHYLLTRTCLIQMRGNVLIRSLPLWSLGEASVSLAPSAGLSLSLRFRGYGYVDFPVSSEAKPFIQALAMHASLSRRERDPRARTIEMNESARRLMFPESQH